ncbi:aldolase/citrate lyase family protein [Microvirga sp. ACRRW]|uniref:HpcH/HpaI aldolase family protein n=1 Tax=Microvirga sp. ACRRW TaxID=2918205 RepID=UPI001EF45D7D|nr:aldolase/citrate lyase family protein [Microvirga sp. ACRRW]MCG7391608.1 aldolase/citrate lyase family protein [Microvirga sp. ACRRW]
MAEDLASILCNNMKSKLARGEVVSSMTARLVRGVEIVRIAKTAGFDSIYVDLEHSSFSFDTTGQICMMALEAGIAPFVRVPTSRPEYIARALDGGALGVIAPDVRTAEEARAIVNAAKFPPFGQRGVSGGLPHLQFRTFPASQAFAAMNEATMVIVQFESAEAVRNADEIMAVEGVDIALIGTNDLMADMDVAGQVDHPKVREAYTLTIEACRKHGKHAGVGGLSARQDLVSEFVRMGARYVSTGTDLSFLLAAATQRARQVAELQL